MRPRSPDRPAPRPVDLLTASLLALLVGFLVVVQLRSQAVVVRHLEAQDNTTIALLINSLNRNNAALREEVFSLESQRSRLLADLAAGQGDPEGLAGEITRLRVVNGTLGVHGPGIVLRLDGPLHDFELQDTINNLRNVGAEALALNGHRLVARSVLQGRSGDIHIDDAAVRSPFVFRAVGDAQGLYDAAQVALGALRGRASVDLRRVADVQITETALRQRFVYGLAPTR